MTTVSDAREQAQWPAEGSDQEAHLRRDGRPRSLGTGGEAHEKNTVSDAREQAQWPAEGSDVNTATATRAGTSTSTSGRTGAPIAALLRLAVLTVDPDGRISYWNRGAQELFGHTWEAVFGHRASGLLPAAAVDGRPGPGRDALDLIDDLTQPAWAGSLAVTDRDGGVREALWWSYRIVEPSGRSLLVLATDAEPLRSGALRLALGDRMLSYVLEYPCDTAANTAANTATSAFPCLQGGPAAVGRSSAISVAARRLTEPAADGSEATRLGTVLPRVSPSRLERIMRQIAPLGHPALEVDGSAPIPVLPYEAAKAVHSPCLPGTSPAVGRGKEMLPVAAPAELLPAPRHRSGDAVPAPGLTPVPPDAYAFPAATPGQLLGQQLALLRETDARVGTTLDLTTTARELCDVAVPRFADFATVIVVEHVFSDSGASGAYGTSGAYGVSDAPTPEAARALTVRRAAAVGGRSGNWSAALPEGEVYTIPPEQSPGFAGPMLLPVVEPALAVGLAADLGVPALSRLIPGRSVLLVPLTARGTLLGRMCFVRHPQRRPFNARDVATATELAARGAVHLDNARLHRLESRAAATLQRSMLPTSPPRIPGVRIAHHYRPGDRQAQVGGDWFDAIQLPGGRVALIVGDVMGHGLLSAAVMGQFRTAVQTMAALDLPPAQLLRHLDNLAQRLGVDHLATCIYAVYDPIHRTLTLANAGHIPPVLARYDGRSELLQIPQGAPIGVGGVAFETVEIPVPDGSWLVLCTDGLVEVREQGIDAGLAALCANVIEPQQTPEDVCQQILAQVHSDDRGDDVALLVAQFEGIPAVDVAQWPLALDPCQVRAARALTRKQLADWGISQLSELAELLVSELVTNALRVASQRVELRLMRVGKLLIEVSDDDHNLPQLRRADADDEDGRGLTLVSNLSRRWGTSRQAVGKVVWFELPLPQHS
ncbi:MAG: SpoIIE family protein phosphatase [Streptomycetaceae bacterium]|nr:SpoIIE family protein phosphatase [Streptomycetaceae bacterium]